MAENPGQDAWDEDLRRIGLQMPWDRYRGGVAPPPVAPPAPAAAAPPPVSTATSPPPLLGRDTPTRAPLSEIAGMPQELAGQRWPVPFRMDTQSTVPLPAGGSIGTVPGPRASMVAPPTITDPNALPRPQFPSPAEAQRNRIGYDIAAQGVGKTTAEQAAQEFARMQQSGSGLQQLRKNHPLIGWPLSVLGGAADVLVPGFSQRIPGTELHHQALMAGEAAREAQGVKEAKEEAETEKTRNPPPELKESDEGLMRVPVTEGPATPVTTAEGHTLQKAGPVKAPKVQFSQGGEPLSVVDADGKEYVANDPAMPANLHPLMDLAKANFQSRDALQHPKLTAQDAAKLNGLYDPSLQKYHLPTGQFSEGMSKEESTAARQSINSSLSGQRGDVRITLAEQAGARAGEKADESQAAKERKWATWTDKATGRTVAGPVSMGEAAGATDMAEMPGSEVRDVQNARSTYHLLTKKGDPNKPETQGVLQLIDSLDHDGKLGVLASRYNRLLTQGIGSSPGDDPRIVTLIDKNMLGQTGAMLAHFGASGGRSPAMLQHWQDLANAGKMDGVTLRSGTLSIADYMKDKGMIPEQAPTNEPAPNAPPPGAKVRDYTQVK